MNTLPFTYKRIIKHLLPKEEHLTVLDLGCGQGVAGEVFNKNHTYKFVGVDIFKPYLKKVRDTGYYDKVEYANLTKYRIKRDTYDVIIIFQVLEHMSKKDGILILKKAMRSAKRAVIASIPNGECEQDEYDKNPYQKHHSKWTKKDFIKLGFDVHGQGLKFVYGGKTYAHGERVMLWQKISFVFSLLLTPLIYVIPDWGAQLICVKYNHIK
jgi:predicted TPR repeat methyltransferase